MDLLTTLLTCSLYLADDDLVRAVAESNSQSNPYFVLNTAIDLTQVDPPAPPKSAREAATRATDILAQGGRPVLGLLQVLPQWMSAFGRDLAEAFEPCTNVAVGTAMLSQFDSECGAHEAATGARGAGAPPGVRPRAPSAGRRRCVLQKYEEAIGLSDFTTVVTLELRYQRPIRPSLADAPILAPTATRSWGPGTLLVPLSIPHFLFPSIP